MNNTKCVMFIACGLMMSILVYGMEPEKLNELFISKDNIFVWSPKERQYHAVTELGEVSVDRILSKNDQPHKIYRAQLVIKEKKEGEEDNKRFLRTTQERVNYYTGNKFINLDKYQRTCIPISFSQEQRDTMWCRFCSCFDNRKEAVLVMDNQNNVYFITHVYREGVDNSKKVRVGYEQVPLLNKKKMLLEINTLKKQVIQLQALAKKVTSEQKDSEKHVLDSSAHLKKRIDRRNRNILIAKIIGGTSFFALVAAFYYVFNSLVASNH